jgi:hypothetical protein
MRATELMIGDWVQINSQFAQIYDIRHNVIGVQFPNEGYDVFEPKHIEPIPLTEELLTRNFPDPSEIVWFPLDEYNGFFNIYWEHPTFGEGEVRLNIQYVHQLQHILKDCGIEKEVEL